LLLVQQAAIGNCLSFDPFPFDESGLGPGLHQPREAAAKTGEMRCRRRPLV
jgi:hypothetical protein